MSEINKQEASAGQSRSRLIKSTLIALIVAIIVTTVFILPAEYDVDPTGIGGKLGLLNLAGTEAETESDTEDADANATPRIVTGAFPEIPDDFDYYEPEGLMDPFSRIQASGFRSDSLTIELAVGEQVEYKVRIKQGDAFVYSWHLDSGVIYTDFHADPAANDQYPERYWIRYAEGEIEGAAGSLVAPFDGNHGWYWLNIEEHPVTITLEVRGFYDSIDELMRSMQ